MKSKEQKMLMKEYFNYLRSDEATVVFITKYLAKNIECEGKWIDVIDYDAYGERDGKTAFNYMVIELFNRKIKPHYPKGSELQLKKAITWKAAHEDINKQRSVGIKGTKYLILCKLFNKNRGKKEVKLFPNWNEEYGGFDFTGKVPTTTIAKEIDAKPEWHYKVIDSRAITVQQFNRIKATYNTKIYPRIYEEKYVKMTWFLEG